MTETTERQIVLDAEAYEVIRGAVNTTEIGDVKFGEVAEVLPTAMDAAEVEALRTQFVDGLLERKPDWDGSVKKLSSRLVFTIGEAACLEGQDAVTAKSAERVLWRQRRALSWGFAVMLRRDIRRYSSN